MNVYTTGESIELEMDKAIMESCEDIVHKTFIADGEKVEGMLAYLEEKYDVFVGNYEPDNKLVSLSIEWVKSEQN